MSGGQWRGGSAQGRGGHSGGQGSRPQQGQQQQAQYQQRQQGHQQQGQFPARGRAGPPQQGRPYQQSGPPQRSFQPGPQIPHAKPPAQLPAPKIAADQSLPALFPKRPARDPGYTPPGKEVELYVNLFRMSLKQKKPIYRNSTNVESCQPAQGDSKPDPKVGTKDSDQPRKIPSKLRRAAVDAAIKTWVANNNPADYSKELTYNYVLDVNGSVMYSLFDIFVNKAATELSLQVEIQDESIIDQKLVRAPRPFIVKIYPGERVDVQKLFDACNNRQNVDHQNIQELVRTLQVLLRSQIISLDSHVVTKYNIYPFLPGRTERISHGVEINKGYSISVRLSEGGVNLNIANKVGAFHEQMNLVDMLMNVYRVRDLNKPLSQIIIDKMKKEIRNKQIESRSKNFGTKDRPHYRKYRVEDIAGSSEDKLMLVDKKTKEPKEVTIAQYHKMEYGVVIKYPKLPCIIYKGRKLPLEICHLIDKQRVLRKMTPDETAEIIKKAARPPNEYFEQLKLHRKEVSSSKQPLNDFGIDFDPQLRTVKGRQLAQMALRGFNKNNLAIPQDGQYSNNDKFIRPVTVQRWAVAILIGKENERDIMNRKEECIINVEKVFCQKYAEMGRGKGVKIANVSKVHYIDATANFGRREIEIKQGFKRELKKWFDLYNQNQIEHVIIVLPKDPELSWVYSYLKYLEVLPGPKNAARTSCVKYSNFFKNRFLTGDNIDHKGQQFISNLWLKHNSKLGGANFVLEDKQQTNFLRDGFIFISVDVCHPAPGDELFQSVAAVVGSWDLNNEKIGHHIALRVQMKAKKDKSQTREDVEQIDGMFNEVIEGFKAKKGKLPSRIVVLRDGVSEGQFKMVLDEELNKVTKMLNSKYNRKRPPITCLVVQKRHDIRFMLKEPVRTRRGDWDYNIQPGTVVDSDIVYPHDHSFYSSPHKALQGVSRPPYFYVICDENQFSVDEMQSMMQALSYLSPRCNKGTSIPTPVNLADLAAERGKSIVVNWCEDNVTKKMKDEEKIKAANLFLTTKMASQGYKGTLYHV